MNLIKILKNLPDTPGVYLYKNKDKKIIYVGKAVNLKRRVSQYFKRGAALGAKTASLVSQINSIKYYCVNSEIEALILEASLIKKYQPKFNSLLKDDRSYLYISISKDKLPIISPAFKSNLDKSSTYFGPFPSAKSVKTLLKTLRRIFPFYISHYPVNKKCFYCHLGVCPGPNPDPIIYKKNIRRIKKILNGQISGLLRRLNHQMQMLSKHQQYEKALSLRNQIESLNYISTGWQSLTHLYTEINLPEDNIQKAILELVSVLQPYIPKLKNILRLEACDISNLGSNYFVGSLVVFENGIIDHQQYKKFKIYTQQTQDDQLMIKEVIYRRLKHIEWGTPDLILVDGGKPQVSAANKVSPNIPIIGLAKKEETIVIKDAKNWQEIKLPKHSPSLLLLQSLRDEAHRFANSYRRNLMQKNFINKS